MSVADRGCAPARRACRSRLMDSGRSRLDDALVAAGKPKVISPVRRYMQAVDTPVPFRAHAAVAPTCGDRRRSGSLGTVGRQSVALPLCRPLRHPDAFAIRFSRTITDDAGGWIYLHSTFRECAGGPGPTGPAGSSAGRRGHRSSTSELGWDEVAPGCGRSCAVPPSARAATRRRAAAGPPGAAVPRRARRGGRADLDGLRAAAPRSTSGGSTRTRCSRRPGRTCPEPGRRRRRTQHGHAGTARCCALSTPATRTSPRCCCSTASWPASAERVAAAGGVLHDRDKLTVSDDADPCRMLRADRAAVPRGGRGLSPSGVHAVTTRGP